MNPWYLSSQELDHIKQPVIKEEYEKKKGRTLKLLWALCLVLPALIFSPVFIIGFLLMKLSEFIARKYCQLTPQIKSKEQILIEDNNHLRAQNKKLLQRVGQKGIYR